MAIFETSSLFTLAVILIAGYLGGLSAKRLGLPSITGQIVAGVAIGPSGASLLSHTAMDAMTPLTEFALGLITVSVGSHIQIPRLRNAGRRLSWLIACEVVVTPLIVFLACYYLLGSGWVVATLLSALAVSTAPATTLALVREQRAKGVFVKTLIAEVALNNIACILMFELARVAVRDTLQGHIENLGLDLLAPFQELGLAALLGAATAGLLVFVSKHQQPGPKTTTASLIAILLAAGVANSIEISSLLTCLFLGVTLANLAPRDKHLGSEVFANFEHAILALFFTYAGVGIHLDELQSTGLLVFGVVAARFLGKSLAGFIAMGAAGASPQLRNNIGMALVPQAGVAVGLLLVAKAEPAFAEFSSLLVSVGLGSVALNEVVGPIATRKAIAASGEANRDRARLLDFIHEEHLVINLQANDKEDALRQLCDVLVRTNQLDVNKSELMASILDREAQLSTCLGQGLAIPHGILPEDEDKIAGVVGISEKGLDLDAPDAEPVHLIFLIATPESARERHTQVLSALTGSIFNEPEIKSRLIEAKTAAEASEIFHGEAFADYNYLLGDEAGEY